MVQLGKKYKTPAKFFVLFDGETDGRHFGVKFPMYRRTFNFILRFVFLFKMNPS